MSQADPPIDPTAFLDRICASVTGVRKSYISDLQGAILAESSGGSDDYSLTLVRSFPKYVERLGKLGFGSSQSMVVESEDASVVVYVSSPLFITFVCDLTANFALLTEVPTEMGDFLAQLKTFVENPDV
jgi:predicted regulator of Ras-like GTPase activity (Roadblock/LC7/MglB family)